MKSEMNYTQQDHLIWSMLFERLQPAMKRTNKEYKAGMDIIGLPEDRVPNLKELNNTLVPVTGWQYKIAEGEVSNKDFLIALSEKTFLASSAIRSMEEFEFCKLPDIFHDVYGHAAMLADQKFCMFLENLGRLAIKFSDNDEAVAAISNIYWYTAEVGVVFEDGDLHYYGGSIISSLSEIDTVYDPGTKILPYVVEEVMETTYDSYNVNSVYFYVNDLQELNASVQEIEKNLNLRYRQEKESVDVEGPHQWKVKMDKVESYGRAYQQLEDALGEIPQSMWKFKPSSKEWSIHEIIIHLADMEANAYVRLLKALAEPGGTIMPLDQNAWTENLFYDEQDSKTALEVFKWLRIKTYNTLKMLPQQRWDNYMNHPESGTVTLMDWLDNYEDHGRVHVAQIKRIHNQWEKNNVLVTDI